MVYSSKFPMSWRTKTAPGLSLYLLNSAKHLFDITSSSNVHVHHLFLVLGQVELILAMITHEGSNIPRPFWNVEKPKPYNLVWCGFSNPVFIQRHWMGKTHIHPMIFYWVAPNRNLCIHCSLPKWEE